MLEITSVSNNQVKEVVKLQQKKYRNQSEMFLLEGFKPIYEAFCVNFEIEKVFVTKEHVEKFSFIKDKLILVTDAVIEKISTTETAPEAVAVAKQVKFTLNDTKNHKKIALIENIKDAGNLGTLIRSAAAFGIESIVLCGDTIDIYNPKVVRSAVGALFKIPIIKTELEVTKQFFSGHNFIATVVNHDDTINPEQANYKKPFVIMLGSEADGLSAQAIAIADEKTTIPMTKSTESLNLSVAGSILFYIASR